MFTYLFQVIVPAAGLRGYLDASDFESWLKHVEVTRQGQKENVRKCIVQGQVIYNANLIPH